MCPDICSGYLCAYLGRPTALFSPCVLYIVQGDAMFNFGSSFQFYEDKTVSLSRHPLVENYKELQSRNGRRLLCGEPHC